MIVVMSPSATKKNIDNVIKKLESLHLRTHLSETELLSELSATKKLLPTLKWK